MGIFYDHHADQHTTRIGSEQALWRAVITQALMDASTHSKKMEAKYEKSQAICWLGSMSEDFKTVCDYAGFNPASIREKSLAALKRDCQWRAQSKPKRIVLPTAMTSITSISQPKETII